MRWAGCRVYYRAMNEPELSAFGRGGQDENRRSMISPWSPPKQVLLIHDSRTLVSRNLRRFASAELLISTHVPNWALAVSLIHHPIFRQVLIHQNPRALTASYKPFSKSPLSQIPNLRTQIPLLHFAQPISLRPFQCRTLQHQAATLFTTRLSRIIPLLRPLARNSVPGTPIIQKGTIRLSVQFVAWTRLPACPSNCHWRQCLAALSLGGLHGYAGRKKQAGKRLHRGHQKKR